MSRPSLSAHFRLPSRSPLTGAALALLLSSSAAAAQDSLAVATPDPTPADLEVYALAVDSSRWADEDVVVLLDERILRVEEDGTHSFTLRSVRQARTDDMARRLAEIGLPFDSGRERMTLDWARVVSADGDILSGPVHAQVMDAPVNSSSPIYTDGKLVRASLGAAEAGRLLDVRFTRHVNDPAISGDLLQTMAFNGGTPVRRARFVIDAPEGMSPRIVEENLPESAAVTRANGRVVREWRMTDIEPVESEPFAATPNDVLMRVAVGGSLGWDDVGRWYAPLLEGRMEVDAELASQLEDIVGDATSRSDSLRALHRWVAQDIRYVSLSLGLGGYQPRLPSEVVESGLGDCKDKAVLFIALARHMGVEAWPVLIRTSGSVRTDLPSPRAFNHMVAAVRAESGWTFLDLTAPTAAYGAIVPNLQGQTGLLVRDDGTSELVELPVDRAESNRSSIVITGELQEDGTLVAEYEEVVTGTIQYRVRGEFDQRLNERALTSLRQNLANRVGRGGVADSVEYFNGLDLDAPARLWAHVTVEDRVEEIPGGRLFAVGLSTYGSPALIERLEEEDERQFPIDGAAVFGLREHHSEYRITLPEGWTAELPENVVVEGPFGSYRSIYQQNGRELLVTRTIRGTDVTLAPDRAGELLEWFRPLAADRVQNIVLTVPGEAQPARR